VVQEERIEGFQNLRIAHSRFHRHAQGFAGVLIQYGQHLVGPAAGQLVMDEVYAPDMVLISGAQSDDGTVLVIEALPFLVTLRYLEALFPPQPLYFLVIDLPAFNAEQLGNLPVAIAAILLCQSDQSQLKAVIIFRGCLIALCGPCHADRSASPPLGRSEYLTHMDHGLTQIGNRQARGFR